MLLLELPLLDRILPDDDRPLTPLENEVLRGETGGEGGGCSVLTGDWRTGEATSEPYPARSKEGISRMSEQGDAEIWVGEGTGTRVGHTSFKFVSFSIVSNVWGLGFSDLHLTVFLGLSQGKILLIPLQTRIGELVDYISPSTVRVRGTGGSRCHPGPLKRS